MAGDINDKHADWNSRLSTRRGKLLRELVSDLWTGHPNYQPIQYLRNPRYLRHRDNQEHLIPVYLTPCSALSWDHLPLLIETMCQSSFHHPPDSSDFRLTHWAKFQTHLENQIPFDPELHNEMAIDKCVENFSGVVLKALAASAPKC